MFVSFRCFDDLFLLCGANCESVRLLRVAFDDFGDQSGLRPNLQKSNMFVSSVSEDLKNDLVQCSGMAVKELPVKYLGVPLISTRLRVRVCEEIKKKMLMRVQSWTAKALSYAGRVQLVVAVLHSIQAYWCTIFVLPKKVLKEVDEILRRFIWTGTEMKKHGAKVAWSEVCCPKNEGGLGIKCIVTWNKACMMRHLWDVARKKDSLWVKWCHMFMLNGRNLWNMDIHGEVSWTWRKILKLRQIAQSFIKYKIGNGRDTWMWLDNWHPNGPLVKHYGPRIVYDSGRNITDWVSNFIQNNRWNLPIARSRDLINIKNNMPLYRLDDSVHDYVEWSLHKSGSFSVASAWEAIREHHIVVEWASVLWHKDSIPRCSIIAWLVCRNRLNTKDRLLKWGVVTEDSCILCGMFGETRDHLFFHCDYSTYIWKDVIHKCNFQYRSLSWNEELQYVIECCQGRTLGARILRVAFCATIYCLWQERNKRIFQHCNCSSDNVIRDIEGYICAKARNWSVKRNLENWEVCHKWGIVESILI